MRSLYRVRSTHHYPVGLLCDDAGISIVLSFDLDTNHKTTDAKNTGANQRSNTSSQDSSDDASLATETADLRSAVNVIRLAKP